MRILNVFIILLYPFVIFGQAEVLNISLTDPSATIAYRNFSNQIAIKNYDKDSTIMVRRNRDTLTRIGTESYRYTFEGGKSKTDTLIAIKNNEVIAQKIYSIEFLEHYQIYLGNLRDSLVTKQDILENLELLVTYEPQLAIPCTHVMRCSGIIIKPNGKVIPFERDDENSFNNISEEKLEREASKKRKRQKNFASFNSQFDSKQHELIKRLKKGEVLEIQSCVMSCSSCALRNVSVQLRFIVQ